MNRIFKIIADRPIFHLIIFITFFALACASQNPNTQNLNPIIPDHFDLPLTYKVKLNGASNVNIQYTDPNGDLQKITIGLGDRGGIQVFEFIFEIPGDVKYISAHVPKSDLSHTLLFVTANGFTKSGIYDVEINF